jgi:hypothetical protein
MISSDDGADLRLPQGWMSQRLGVDSRSEFQAQEFRRRQLGLINVHSKIR